MSEQIDHLLQRLRACELAAADLYDASFPDADAKYCYYLIRYPDALIEQEDVSPAGAHNTPEELERFRKYRESEAAKE
jgi:hypothetical protein